MAVRNCHFKCPKLSEEQVKRWVHDCYGLTILCLVPVFSMYRAWGCSCGNIGLLGPSACSKPCSSLLDMRPAMVVSLRAECCETWRQPLCVTFSCPPHASRQLGSGLWVCLWWKNPRRCQFTCPFDNIHLSSNFVLVGNYIPVWQLVCLLTPNMITHAWVCQLCPHSDRSWNWREKNGIGNWPSQW